jgi:hypothetical protein
MYESGSYVQISTALSRRMKLYNHGLSVIAFTFQDAQPQQQSIEFPIPIKGLVLLALVRQCAGTTCACPSVSLLRMTGIFFHIGDPSHSSSLINAWRMTRRAGPGMHHHTTWITKIAIIVLECQHHMTQISLLAHSVPLPGNGVSQRLAQAPGPARRRHLVSVWSAVGPF